MRNCLYLIVCVRMCVCVQACTCTYVFAYAPESSALEGGRHQVPLKVESQADWNCLKWVLATELGSLQEKQNSPPLSHLSYPFGCFSQVFCGSKRSKTTKV